MYKETFRMEVCMVRMREQIRVESDLSQTLMLMILLILRKRIIGSQMSEHGDGVGQAWAGEKVTHKTIEFQREEKKRDDSFELQL